MKDKKLTINYLLIDWHCPICGGETTRIGIVNVRHEHDGILYELQPNKAYRDMNNENIMDINAPNTDIQDNGVQAYADRYG